MYLISYQITLCIKHVYHQIMVGRKDVLAGNWQFDRNGVTYHVDIYMLTSYVDDMLEWNELIIKSSLVEILDRSVLMTIHFC